MMPFETSIGMQGALFGYRKHMDVSLDVPGRVLGCVDRSCSPFFGGGAVTEKQTWLANMLTSPFSRRHAKYKSVWLIIFEEDACI